MYDKLVGRINDNQHKFFVTRLSNLRRNVLYHSQYLTHVDSAMDNATKHARKSNQPNDAFGPVSHLKQAMTMRQHGDSMMTNAVRAWLGSVWVIIFLMSLIEGTVWFFVSQYFVPESVRWVAFFLAPLFFVGIFVLIWIIDVSFITSERPIHMAGDDKYAPNASDPDANARIGRTGLFGHIHIGEQALWRFGVVIRLGIVLISIAITAPFLTQTIRTDEIADKYQTMLEQTRKDKEAELVVLLDDEIARLQKRRQDLIGERKRLDVEQASAIRGADAAIATARKQADNYYGEYLAQIQGHEGRVAGRGPKARASIAARDKALVRQEQLIREKEENRKKFEQRSSKLADELAQVDQERAKKERQRAQAREVFTSLSFATFAKQYELEVPSDTIGMRVRLLAELAAEDLRGADPENTFGPVEKLAFHFKSVEGLSQALLGILFLSMLALKAFEPKGVKLYFNEELQQQWRRYQEGGFDQEPGFIPSTDQNAYNHFGFADAYLSFNATPELFWRQQEKSRAAKIRFDEIAQNGYEREQRYQEEVLQNRVESDRKLREIVYPMEVEEERKYVKKEWRIKSEKLDYQLEKEKEDLDNRYRELGQQYKAETDQRARELEENKKQRIKEERKRLKIETERADLEKEKLRLENEALGQQTKNLKQNQKLHEQARTKFLGILEERKETAKRRKEREEARNKREKEEAERRDREEEREHQLIPFSKQESSDIPTNARSYRRK
uniref:Uncharacterized protein n=1 Tax=Candidatus Kentrum sp. MB TaxID=2138164 RepID=A0A451BDT3_9GAMM|nr:MAG: hypothetical protein BECKMB1821I_GA0114274_105420 [Candidatus Kentron sp. MB]VFK76440.1 MAG: hypothetical protein BECKMB1821H_GA0114242_105621 [Candidatus Kentron sp. MB]